MAADPAALRAPFERWLAARWRDDVEDLRVGEIYGLTAGFSAETLVAPLQYRRGGEACEDRIVLRLENPEPAIYPVQVPGLDIEVELQYRTMEGLSRATKAPLAPLHGFEPDAAILGAPFFAMGFVEGQVPLVNPSYTTEGFFVDATADERRRMLEDGLRMLAEIHRVDWKTADLDWLVPPGVTPGVLRQLDLWEEYTLRELRGRVHPTLDRTFEWLHTNLPEGLALGVSWGDSRPGNIIWQDFRAACLTDFENVAIAPPEIDIGWWLMFDRCHHEGIEVARLPGEPTREEQRDFYAACVGREIGDLYYFEVFAAMRYAAVTVRVMNRLEERGLVAADHPVWLQNPGSTCLAQLGMSPGGA